MGKERLWRPAFGRAVVEQVFRKEPALRVVEDFHQPCLISGCVVGEFASIGVAEVRLYCRHVAQAHDGADRGLSLRNDVGRPCIEPAAGLHQACVLLGP
jgi:hypothetical protein